MNSEPAAAGPADDPTSRHLELLRGTAVLLDRNLRMLAVLRHAELARRTGLRQVEIRAVELVMEFGTITTGQLSQLLGLSSGGTTALIDRIEQAGYVVREKSPHDRRRIVLRPVVERCLPLLAPSPGLQPLLEGLRTGGDPMAVTAVNALLTELTGAIRTALRRTLRS